MIALHLFSAPPHLRMSFMASLYLRRGQLTFLEPSVSSSWRSAFTGRSSSMHATWPIQSVPDESYLDFCRFRAIHYLIVCDVGIPMLRMDLKCLYWTVLRSLIWWWYRVQVLLPYSISGVNNALIVYLQLCMYCQVPAVENPVPKHPHVILTVLGDLMSKIFEAFFFLQLVSINEEINLLTNINGFCFLYVNPESHFLSNVALSK